MNNIIADDLATPAVRALTGTVLFSQNFPASVPEGLKQ